MHAYVETLQITSTPKCTPTVHTAMFETARLTLRPLRLSDTKELFDECTHDPDVTRYLTWKPHTELAETLDFIKHCHANQSERSYTWAVGERVGGRLAGIVQCSVHDEAVAIGYLFGRSHWGKGYASEAVRALSDIAEKAFAPLTLWAYCDTGNQASIRLLERLGFERRGIISDQIINPNMTPPGRNAYYYARDVKPSLPDLRSVRKS